MTDSVDQVCVPFRQYLKPGQSHFNVNLPPSYLHHRKFQFASLTLQPDYFSQKAAAYNLDVERDNKFTFEYSIYLSTRIKNLNLYPVEYNNDKNLNKSSDYLTAINAHFEAIKPVYMQTTPCFFDWIDTGLSQHNVDTNAEIGELPSVYYGYALTEQEQDVEVDDLSQDLPPAHERLARFYNALPQSVKFMPGLTHWKLPIDYTVDRIIQRIRIRLHIAPFTSISLSTDSQLKDLGFSPAQIGPRGKVSKFYINNASPGYLTLVAEKHPLAKLAVTTCKMSAQPTEQHFTTDIVSFQVNNTLIRNPPLLVEALSKCLDQLRLQSNVVVLAHYDPNEAIVKFTFPPPQDLTCALYVPYDLALGLGFDKVPAITPELVAKSFKKEWDIGEIRDKAMALVFDSGLVVVCVDQSSSNRTSGALDTIMGILSPTSDGVLQLNHTATAASLPLYSGSGSLIPIPFKLLRIYDNEELLPFEWKTGSFVYGLLKSV